MPPDPPAVPKFPATRWSVVLLAAGSGTQAQAALEDLCRLYWFPIYCFARQQGCSPEDAEDETQEFLSRAIGGQLLTSANPDKGRLRTHLLNAFQCDLIDSRRRAGRVKRGGKIEFISLESLQAEDRFKSTPPLESPTAAFDRAWSMTCLDTTVGALENEYAARGRASVFQSLRPFLDPGSDADYTAASLATGLEANAIRQAVYRLRQRFRILLRQTIADTLENPTASLIDEELAALRAALEA